MRYLLLATALLACLPFSAAALDNSTAVKVTPLLKTTTSWDGKPIVYPQGQAEVTMLIIEFAPGAQTGWHEHPVPSFAYILEGSLEVMLSTGEKKQLHAGDSAAEVVNILHNGRALDGKGVKLLVMYAGAVDKMPTLSRPDFTPAAPAAK